MKTAPLYELHRPTSLDQVVGQPKAVAAARRLMDAGLGGQSVFISGPSGTGKTTLARIMAHSLADPFFVTEVNATEVGAETLERIRNAVHLYGGGKGGRAWIINEVHLLSARTIAALLDIAEGLPGHCALFFTTTKDGEGMLIEDKVDAGPFLSRCRIIGLTNQGTAEPFAELAHAIAGSVGLNGAPMADAVKLVRKHRGNMRAVLQAVADGALIGGEA